MKKILTLLIVVALAIFEAYQEQGKQPSVLEGLAGSAVRSLDRGATNTQKGNKALERAYNNRQSDLQVQGEGIVVKVLRDDLDGSRHQKFILKVGAKQTALVAHNIDLAPRINALKEGDRVEYYGEYEWNSRGGVIHWTHKDPKGYHKSGWLKHNGKTYQ